LLFLNLLVINLSYPLEQLLFFDLSCDFHFFSHKWKLGANIKLMKKFQLINLKFFSPI
jgi:hypothetical protein